ncbi:MAG: hypothetical protein Q7K57_52360 [Burkholderiaceae bacterium]|nr:hypothetical protein [Burkholderiaceae bacterium]
MKNAEYTLKNLPLFKNVKIEEIDINNSSILITFQSGDENMPYFLNKDGTDQYSISYTCHCENEILDPQAWEYKEIKKTISQADFDIILSKAQIFN